jgi:peptidyl-tRNA hydrolase, PTH1 family
LSHAIELIVGLGNPGPDYQPTRHNVGAWLADKLADHAGTTLRSEAKFFGEVAKLTCFDHPCWLLKPSTYMNESGKSIAALARFYKIAPEAILVAHDELDFPAGTIRIKRQGGHGGHNGLRDTISQLHSQDFFRLRIGIGHPGNKDDVSPYVLSRPSKHDEQLITQSIDEGMDVISDLIAGNTEQAFHQLHSD